MALNIEQKRQMCECIRAEVFVSVRVYPWRSIRVDCGCLRGDVSVRKYLYPCGCMRGEVSVEKYPCGCIRTKGSVGNGQGP